MRIGTFGKEASEKELVARPSLNKGVSRKHQKRAELLHSRIEELDRRLAILNSEREKSWDFSRSPLDGVRPMDDTYVVETLTAIIGWWWLLIS